MRGLPLILSEKTDDVQPGTLCASYQHTCQVDRRRLTGAVMKRWNGETLSAVGCQII